MTSPEPSSTRKPRPGQVVTFTHPDPYGGADLVGKALVLPSAEEGHLNLLPLGLFHLEVDPDNVQPAKLEDVLPAAVSEKLAAQQSSSSS